MTQPSFRFFRSTSSFASFAGALILASFATAGCGSSDSGGTTDDTDTGTTDDSATTDTAKGDTAKGDTAVVDTAVPTEGGIDGAADSPADVKTDATEGGTDGGTDAVSEGGTDAADATAVDSASDAVLDAVSDVAIDAPDVALDVSTDALDGGVAPFGTKLAAGGLDIRGITADGYVIVQERTGTKALKAIPLSGGAAVTIDAASADSLVTGKTVFSWHGLDADGIGALVTWTAAGGAKATATTTFSGIAAADGDGTTVTYLDAATAAGTANYVVSAPDATAKKTLDTVDLSFCNIDMRYAALRPIAQYCKTSASPLIASFDPTAGTKATLLASSAKLFDVDAAGAKVLTVTAGGALAVIAATGGTPTAVDSGVAIGAILPDGNSVVYRTTAEALKRSPVPTVAVTTLVATNVTAFLDLSPDGAWVVYRNARNTSSGLTDLFLASSTTAGTPTTLNAATTTDINNFGNTFTTDNSRVIFGTDALTSGVAALKVKPVAGGSIATLSTAAWWALAGTGSKVVFDDAFVAAAGTTPARADLRIVDSATTTTSTLLQSKIDALFWLSPAKDKVVYTYSFVAADQGLYVGALP
jgi:hypothetical protein